jgi:hypothetical protein
MSCPKSLQSPYSREYSSPAARPPKILAAGVIKNPISSSQLQEDSPSYIPQHVGLYSACSPVILHNPQSSLWTEPVATLLADILERSMQIMKLYPTNYSAALRMSFAEHIQVHFLDSRQSEEVGKTLGQLLDMGILRQPRDLSTRILTSILRHFRNLLLEEMAADYYRKIVLLKWITVTKKRGLSWFVRHIKQTRCACREEILRELARRGLAVQKRKKLPLDMREIDNQQTSFHDFTYLCVNSSHSEGESMLLGNHEYSPFQLIRYPKEQEDQILETDSTLDMSEMFQVQAKQRAQMAKNFRQRAETFLQPQKEVVFRRMTLVGKSFLALKEIFKTRLNQESLAIQHYNDQLLSKRNSLFRAMISVVWLQQKNLLDHDSLEEVDQRP